MQEWLKVFISWLPLIILAAFWIFFIPFVRRYQQLVDRNFKHMDRVEALLERIAAQAEQQERKA